MRSRVDSRRLLDWREIALATAGMGDLLPDLQPGRRGLARPSQECGRVLRDSPCALHAQYWACTVLPKQYRGGAAWGRCQDRHSCYPLHPTSVGKGICIEGG